MTDDEILAEFRAADALLQGHFLLSSGRHSEYYLQCARVLMDTERAGRLAAALAAKLPRELRQAIDIVVSPAMGGVIVGHEMGRALGKPAIFVERPTGTFELRRGFAIDPGDVDADRRMPRRRGRARGLRSGVGGGGGGGEEQGGEARESVHERESSDFRWKAMHLVSLLASG